MARAIILPSAVIAASVVAARRPKRVQSASQWSCSSGRAGEMYCIDRLAWGAQATHDCWATVARPEAQSVWIDHNRIALIARQFLVTHNNPNVGVTVSYNEFDGETAYSATCNGSHYYAFLILGTGDTVTMQGSWLHNTSGRGPHAGGNDTAKVIMHWVKNYNTMIPGHAADASTGASMLYEGTVLERVTTPFQLGGGGHSYAPLASNLSSTNAACQSALGRPEQRRLEGHHVPAGCASPRRDVRKSLLFDSRLPGERGAPLRSSPRRSGTYLNPRGPVAAGRAGRLLKNCPRSGARPLRSSSGASTPPSEATRLDATLRSRRLDELAVGRSRP